MKLEIKLTVGETYKTELENKSGSGYLWVVEKNKDKITSVLLKTTITEGGAKKTPAGGSAKINLMITALAEGRSNIKLANKRDWDKKAMPIQEIEMTVIVEK